MPEVDPIIHQQTRLRIMAALVGMEDGAQVDFGYLLDLFSLSDGNLSVHLQKLEGAKLIAVTKEFVDRHPKTWMRITKRGRKAFEGYVASLESIIGGEKPMKGTRRTNSGKEGA
jgi:DNA-binding transcriptional ArsR family regulator